MKQIVSYKTPGQWRVSLNCKNCRSVAIIRSDEKPSFCEALLDFFHKYNEEYPSLEHEYETCNCSFVGNFKVFGKWFCFDFCLSSFSNLYELLSKGIYKSPRSDWDDAVRLLFDCVDSKSCHTPYISDFDEDDHYRWEHQLDMHEMYYGRQIEI